MRHPVPGKNSSMEFITKVAAPEAVRSDCLAIGLFADGTLTPAAKRIDAASKGAIKAAIKSGDATGKRGNSVLLRGLTGVSAARVLLVGLGAPGELGDSGFGDAVRGALKHAGHGAKDVTLAATEWGVKGRDAAWQARTLVVAARETAFRTDELKSKKDDAAAAPASVGLLLGARSAAIEAALKQGVALANGMELTNARRPTSASRRRSSARSSSSTSRCSTARASRSSAWARSCRSPMARPSRRV